MVKKGKGRPGSRPTDWAEYFPVLEEDDEDEEEEEGEEEEEEDSSAPSHSDWSHLDANERWEIERNTNANSHSVVEQQLERYSSAGVSRSEGVELFNKNWAQWFQDDSSEEVEKPRPRGRRRGREGSVSISFKDAPDVKLIAKLTAKEKARIKEEKKREKARLQREKDAKKAARARGEDWDPEEWEDDYEEYDNRGREDEREWDAYADWDEDEDEEDWAEEQPTKSKPAKGNAMNANKKGANKKLAGNAKKPAGKANANSKKKTGNAAKGKAKAGNAKGSKKTATKPKKKSWRESLSETLFGKKKKKEAKPKPKGNAAKKRG